MKFIEVLAAVAVLAGITSAQTLTADAPTSDQDLRVQATLRNGHAIIGVALSSRLSEKAARTGYTPDEDKTDRRCGVRVWFYRNLDGYIFLPHRTVEKLDVLGALTTAESRALRSAVAQARQARDETRKRELAKSKEASSGKPAETGKTGKPGDKETGSALTTEESALLKEFPPEQGWGAERFGEIQRRKIVLHIQPTEQERKFIEVFTKWASAQSKREALREGGGKRTETPETPPEPPSEPTGKRVLQIG